MNSWLFSIWCMNITLDRQAAKRARFIQLNCWRRNKINLIPLFMFFNRPHYATEAKRVLVITTHPVLDQHNLLFYSISFLFLKIIKDGNTNTLISQSAWGGHQGGLFLIKILVCTLYTVWKPHRSLLWQIANIKSVIFAI